MRLYILGSEPHPSFFSLVVGNSRYDVIANVSGKVLLLLLHNPPAYTQGTLTVRNTSTTPVYGPLQVVFTNLTPGVTIANASGTYLGHPYITVPGVTTLTTGQSASVQVQFSNPGHVKVSFTPTTYSGQFN